MLRSGATPQRITPETPQGLGRRRRCTRGAWRPEQRLGSSRTRLGGNGRPGACPLGDGSPATCCPCSHDGLTVAECFRGPWRRPASSPPHAAADGSFWKVPRSSAQRAEPMRQAAACGHGRPACRRAQAWVPGRSTAVSTPWPPDESRLPGEGAAGAGAGPPAGGQRSCCAAATGVPPNAWNQQAGRARGTPRHKTLQTSETAETRQVRPRSPQRRRPPAARASTASTAHARHSGRWRRGGRTPGGGTVAARPLSLELHRPRGDVEHGRVEALASEGRAFGVPPLSQHLVDFLRQKRQRSPRCPAACPSRTPLPLPGHRPG